MSLCWLTAHEPAPPPLARLSARLMGMLGNRKQCMSKHSLAALYLGMHLPVQSGAIASAADIHAWEPGCQQLGLLHTASKLASACQVAAV